MKHRLFLQCLAVFAVMIALTVQMSFADTPTPSEGMADWIYKGGLIYTVDTANPKAESVAVRGNADLLQLVFK